MKKNYYYRNESLEQQIQYRKLYEILKRHDEVLICGEDDYIVNHLDEIVKHVCLDNPDLFYVDANGFGKQITSMGIVKIYPSYTESPDRIREISKKIDDEIQSLIEVIDYQNLDGYGIIKYIYDYFINSITILPEALDNAKCDSVMGVWIDREASDIGTALAFKQILEQKGIISTVISGICNSRRTSWNVIELNNETYHIDISEGLLHINQYGVFYDYFMLSDTMMMRDHEWQISFDCSDSGMNYFSVQNDYIEQENQLWHYIDKSFENGKRFFYFQIRMDEKDIEVILDKAKLRVQENYLLLGETVELDFRINKKQRIIHIFERTGKELVDNQLDNKIEDNKFASYKIAELNEKSTVLSVEEGRAHLENTLSSNISDNTKNIIRKIVEGIKAVEKMDEVDALKQEEFKGFIMNYLPEIVRIALILEKESSLYIFQNQMALQAQFDKVLTEFSYNLHAKVFDYYEDKRIELLSCIKGIENGLDKEEFSIEVFPYEIDQLIEQSSIKAYLDAWHYITKIKLPEDILVQATNVERQLEKLDKTIAEYPEKECETDRFKDCYIPDCLKLVSVYYEKIRIGMDDNSLEIITKKITESMSTLERAIIEKLQEIHRYNLIEASAEAVALTSIMEQDGYVDPIYKI